MEKKERFRQGPITRLSTISVHSIRSCYGASTALLLLFIISTETPHLFGAELFPFSPPTNQQRTLEQPGQVRAQLSREDITRAARLADQAKRLGAADQQQFRENIQRKLKETVRQNNFSQAQYYTELLTQLGQETR